MTRDDLTALIARVEVAAVAEQSDVLAAALMAARKAGWFAAKQYSSALRMLAASAYESAAMTLVPEGWRVYRMERLSCAPDAEWRADIIKTYGSVGQNARASHLAPALALTAAALRARLAQMGDGA